MSNFDLVLKLLLQLTVILGTCRLVTIVGRRYFGQTDVVCEMIAGVMLGPSLLGIMAPELQKWLFPIAPLIISHRFKNPQSVNVDFICCQSDWTGVVHVFNRVRV
jgi:hypothetical protein